MKHLFIASAMLTVVSAWAVVPAPLGGFSYGSVQAPAGTEWENPQALSLNKEQPHAYMFNFGSVEQAKKVLPENSRYYQSLDGTWKFNWVNHPDKRPTEFFKPGFDTSNWDDIKVPGCWNVQGIQKDGSQKYGTPIYVNQASPFYAVRGKEGDWKNGVMREPPKHWTTYKDRNEVGSYVREFTVPSDWKGREVYINFDGVDSFFYLWINGQYVGFSKNSRNTASFNITKYLNPKGENRVAVEVYRHSDASMLEVQDMFRLPGIIRSTYLTSSPSVQIEDMVVRTTLGDDINPEGRATGSVKVNTILRNLTKKEAKGLKVKYEVYPVELYSDKTEGEAISPVTSGVANVNANGQAEVETEFSIPDARLWSAEVPNRYVLVGQLLDKKGKVLETVSSYFGARQVEIRETPADQDEFGKAGRYFYVNKRPVKLKGVNRHENNLSTGHTLTREQMENEVMLMRQGNINHVRNSHYPDDPYWYMLCDKYGIYLEDEANAESHLHGYGPGSISHPVEWRDAHIARNMEMVRANVNHPSIVIWSLGNEGGPGDNYKAAYEAIKGFDTSRPVQYERNNSIVDMGSNQYPGIDWVNAAVTGKLGIKYPFHISEYAHSMGNALGNFVDYWKAMESSNFLCGGAIWDWVDQAIWNYTPDGTRYMGYGNNFGDYPNDGMFCMNGIMFPDFTPKPQYAEVKRVQQNVGVTPIDMKKGEVEVFNKNYFTTLGDLSPRWILTKDGVEVARGENVVRPRMDVSPRGKQTWRIPYDFSKLDGDGEYFVTLQFLLNEDKPWAKAGYVQAEVQLPVRAAAEFAPLQAEGAAPTLTVTAGEDKVAGDGWSVSFNNGTGTIEELSYGGKSYITPGNGPVLSAFRAPVDNDAPSYHPWFTTGLYNLKHKVLGHQSYQRKDGAVVISYQVESQAPNIASVDAGLASGTYKITEGRATTPSDFKFITNQIWTVYPDGSVELQSAINSNNTSMLLPRIGYEMLLPAGLENYTYYGLGPVNNFNDRMTGQDVGRYTGKVKDQFVNFPKPQSMGNREGVRWNTLTDNQGNGLQFVATQGTMSASALPWSELEMSQAKHPHELPPSKGTTLLLDNKVTGLGGASCGQGITLPHQRTYASPQTFGFIIRPVSAGVNLQQQASVSSAGEKPLNFDRDKVGQLRILSADPKARIQYIFTPNGVKAAKGKKVKGQDYVGAINAREGGRIEAWDANNPKLRFTAEYSRIESVPVDVIYASAQEPGDDAVNLLDGDPSTIWHTTYGVTVANYPHWIDFDCHEPLMLKGFTYLPRQSGSNGDIKDYKIEVSLDGKNWTQVASGSFANSKKVQRVDFAPVKGRYVRFTALSSQNGADYAAGSEITILAD